MIKRLLACFLICCFLSCNFFTMKTDQLFVNQELIEASILAVQPAKHIELRIETTNNRDSVLVVSLTVDPKIPDDSLNAARANLILSSFVAILPNQSLKSLTTCRIEFLKKEEALKIRTIVFICPMTADLAIQVDNYKDSSRAAIGYIDPGWTYINKDLNLSLSLKPDWFYASEENNAIVYYAIGSDINQLPQYRTDTDRKVTFLTLRKLTPGAAYTVLQLIKTKEPSTATHNGQNVYQGPAITAGLILNHFDSEDEYLKNLYALFFRKKLPENEIHSYRFGNASFRGEQFNHPDKNGKMIYYLSTIKRFRKVSLVLNMSYSNDKELEEVKHELSDLNIN
jgi:hypothetical protein